MSTHKSAMEYQRNLRSQDRLNAELLSIGKSFLPIHPNLRGFRGKGALLGEGSWVRGKRVGWVRGMQVEGEAGKGSVGKYMRWHL